MGQDLKSDPSLFGLIEADVSMLDWRDQKTLTAREGLLFFMARHKRSALAELRRWAKFTESEQEIIDEGLALEPCEYCGGDDWFCPGRPRGPE
jgi:hypothetical protein